MKIKYKYFIKIYYKIIIAVFVVVLFFTVCIYYVTKKIEPTVLAFCDAKAKSMALKVTNDVVNEHVKEIKYKEIVNLVSNEDGKLVSVKTDVLTMNELSSEISLEIQKQLNNLDNGQILISIGSMTGNKLLYDVGPKFHVNVYPVGNVSVNFISEFSDAGINQTK
ncbi:MAG: sporulation protein YunB, partial [Clostridia bacterium]